MSSNARQKVEKERLILPVEVVTEILTWLPLKPLARAQLVCKEWRSTIRDHPFMEKHMKRNSFVDHWYNTSFSQQSTPKSDWGFCYLHGCDGLLLLKDNLSHDSHVLWNPASRLVLDLPPPHNGSYGLTLSFVPATGNYKLVSFFKDDSGPRGCQLLTPGVPSMEWRLLGGFLELAKAVRTTVVPAGGDVHCVVVTKAGEETVAEIVSLDLETETLTVNRLPGGLFADVGDAEAIDCDGKLGFAAVEKGKQELQVMVLQDFKRKRWCRYKEVIPLPFLKDEDFIKGKKKKLVPLMIKEGEVWFWLEEEKIFVYKIETGDISDVRRCRGLAISDKLYSYKPSLVTFEGMRKESDDKFERLRPRNLLLKIG